MSSLLTAGWWASNRGYIYRGKRILGWSTQRRYILRNDVIMTSFSTHTHTHTHPHCKIYSISVLLLLLCVIAGDIIVQIDRQELSHMTLAQATLALGTSSPLIRLGVYRPSVEDSTFVQLLADNHMLIEFLRPVYVFYTCVPTMYILASELIFHPKPGRHLHILLYMINFSALPLDSLSLFLSFIPPSLPPSLPPPSLSVSLQLKLI